MHNEKPDPLFLKEEPNLSLFSSDNKQFYLYFVIPLLLGIVLADGLGIDISRTAAQHIGLLRFIQSAGIDIRTKSMIFILYLVFAPCYWHYFFRRRKSNSPPSYRLKTASATDSVIMIVLLLVMGLAAYVVIIIGPHGDALITPSRPIRLLLACSQWNISFGIYVGVIVLALAMTLYTPFVIINELLLRLKNRASHIDRSK